MTPQRVTVTPMQGGSRQIVLACSCVSVGRLFTSWESDADALAQLQADHRQRAPLCRHPSIELAHLPAVHPEALLRGAN